MMFKTGLEDLYQRMIVNAIRDGLTFGAYVRNGWYTIEYTGGYKELQTNDEGNANE